MKSLLIYELLNGNFFIEKTGDELLPAEFENLQQLAPNQTWIIFSQLKKEDVKNPAFSWGSYIAYQIEFEQNLKSKTNGQNNFIQK